MRSRGRALKRVRHVSVRLDLYACFIQGFEFHMNHSCERGLPLFPARRVWDFWFCGVMGATLIPWNPASRREEVSRSVCGCKKAFGQILLGLISWSQTIHLEARLFLLCLCSLLDSNFLSTALVFILRLSEQIPVSKTGTRTPLTPLA